MSLFLLSIFGIPLLLTRNLLSILRVKHRGARITIYLLLILAGLGLGVWLFWLFKPQM